MNQLMTELGQVYYQYRPAGPQQPTLMCLPAFGWDATDYNFKHLMARLPSQVGLLAIDTIGVGRSINSQMVRTFPHILANLEDVVHHEHVSNLLLVGHSLGASYAFLYAQQHLDNVCGLVLLEPSYAAMAPQLLANVQSFIENYPQLVQQRQTLTLQQLLAEVNPLNLLAERVANARIDLAAYANPSILTEAQCLPQLVTTLRTAEKRVLTLPIQVLVTDQRLTAYQQSPWCQLGHLVHAPGQHYLHWTNENFVRQQLLIALSQS